MYNLKETFYKVSAIVVLLSSVLYAFVPEIAPWGMAVGVVGLTLTTITMKYPGKSIRGKRLFNLQIISSVFLLISAYMMLRQNMLWVLWFAVGSVLLLYSAIMLPIVYDQEKTETKERENHETNFGAGR